MHTFIDVYYIIHINKYNLSHKYDRIKKKILVCDRYGWHTNMEKHFIFVFSDFYLIKDGLLDLFSSFDFF